MGTEKMRQEFLTWWWHDDQRELRQSCAQGWALHVWISSRADIEVELPREDRNIDYSGYISKSETEAAIESLGLKVKP
ncbi:hypothetical protein [Pseudomonas sp. GV105]|uniref:hypothetical protein n=1 Tax=Pseudomonas sp. GV105 TaxID=2135759 RepID=UPI000D39E2F0|nr:hypothetical protein [Pseudomonas sp. GV105]